jgi:hypothetical protein
VALVRVLVEVGTGEMDTVVVPEPVNVIPIRVVICNVETFFMDKCTQAQFPMGRICCLGRARQSPTGLS